MDLNITHAALLSMMAAVVGLAVVDDMSVVVMPCASAFLAALLIALRSPKAHTLIIGQRDGRFTAHLVLVAVG